MSSPQVDMSAQIQSAIEVPLWVSAISGGLEALAYFIILFAAIYLNRNGQGQATFFWRYSMKFLL